MTKKLMVQTNKKNDEYFTPEIAIHPLLPFLDKSKVIFECAYGGGNLAEHFRNAGFSVVGDRELNFLKDDFKDYYDIIISNPPYSLKEEFLQRAFEIGKPFAFLFPLTTLEGKKRGELFSKNEIQLIIPNKRINFILPEGSGNSGAWFPVAWFCWKLNLPKQLNFVELE
jgi:hypothetical protein